MTNSEVGLEILVENSQGNLGTHDEVNKDILRRENIICKVIHKKIRINKKSWVSWGGEIFELRKQISVHEHIRTWTTYGLDR